MRTFIGSSMEKVVCPTGENSCNAIQNAKSSIKTLTPVCSFLRTDRLMIHVAGFFAMRKGENPWLAGKNVVTGRKDLCSGRDNICLGNGNGVSAAGNVCPVE